METNITILSNNLSRTIDYVESKYENISTELYDRLIALVKNLPNERLDIAKGDFELVMLCEEDSSVDTMMVKVIRHSGNSIYIEGELTNSLSQMTFDYDIPYNAISLVNKLRVASYVLDAIGESKEAKIKAIIDEEIEHCEYGEYKYDVRPIWFDETKFLVSTKSFGNVVSKGYDTNKALRHIDTTIFYYVDDDDFYGLTYLELVAKVARETDYKITITDEYCSNCDGERSTEWNGDLDNPPICPECGKRLLPCNLCDFCRVGECNNANCPFKNIFD